MENNIALRNRIRDNKLKQWQIAEKIGVTEWTLSRYLRKPLPDELAKRVEDAIAELTEGE